ncbi:MAG: hypothetical protein ACC656_01820, partial [Candidatus Heimdallarchaeota archaeon]
STQFRKSLLENGIDSLEWLYDFIPIMGMYSIYIQNKRQKQVKEAYEAELSKDISLSQLSEKTIPIGKSILRDPSSSAYKLARHYFELIVSYTASFDENIFVIIPTSTQLHRWWLTETRTQSKELQIETIDFIDKLLWDDDFLPQEYQISEYEKIAREMVITLQ